MLPQVRYQVFISSTYEDLREERQQVTQAILEAGHFPSGMELFPASDNTQWELIRQVIEECDYYIVIVAGRYGSVGPNGVSYTEMEYDYAVSRGIPVLGFVRDDVDGIAARYFEKNEKLRENLKQFRSKVMSKTCKKFSSPIELGMQVMKSLMHEVRLRPRVGWVRADHARSEEDRQRENRLSDELRDALEKIGELEREIRDRSVLIEEVSRDKLAQGDDIFNFTVAFRDEKKEFVVEEVSVSWNEIFRTIGPNLYGYVVRKVSRWNEVPTYPFQVNVEQLIRSKIVNRIQNRKMDIEEGQIDTCVIQLKELGYLMYNEHTDDEGKNFRGITLTEYGEKQLVRLSTQVRG